MASNEPAVLVVIPTYDEADNLSPAISKIDAEFPGASVLVVDDASPDGTGAVAERIARDRPKTHVLHRTGPRGLGAAYRDGFRWAFARGAYDVVVQMDADLSHPAERLGALVAAITSGADLAIGSRYVAGGGIRGWPLRRELLSRAGGAWSRAWLGLAIRDPTAGFCAWRAGLLEATLAHCVSARGYAFQIELKLRAARAGARIVEVPIVFTERRAGASKMTVAIALEALALIPRLRRGGPAG